MIFSLILKRERGEKLALYEQHFVNQFFGLTWCPSDLRRQIEPREMHFTRLVDGEIQYGRETRYYTDSLSDEERQVYTRMFGTTLAPSQSDEASF